MMHPVFRFWRAGYFLLGSLATASSVQAQIVPDNTLPVNSLVTPGCTICRIDGGTHRGVNLFHSFSEFSIPTGGEALFNNALRIQNIFSRVTGNSVSNIDGLLRTNGTANLFFLNPNGVIFGQNARLEIGGSFLATTANSFKFPNGSEFSATNPQAPPLLRMNITPGLQYGANQPKTTITNRGNLAVGQDLTLAAGNLDLQGQLVAGRDLTLQAQDTVKVRDSSTSPFIASANGNLLVQGNQGVDIFALNHPNSGLFSGGNMVLRSANTVGGDAHYWSGGNFRIEKLDGSLGGLYSPYDPIIRSLGDVSLNAYLGTSLHILAGGEVNIGTAIITGAETGAAGVDFIRETVQLSNGKEVSINGSLQPTLDIRAGVDPAFIGVPGVTGVGFLPPDIFSGLASLTGVPTSANITIGDAWIAAPNGLVFITNQYQPNTALPGGNINLTGTGLFRFGIDVGSSKGNGGSVILDSRGNIVITNSNIDSASTAGNSGDITLLANKTVSLTNSRIGSFSTVGNSGDITLLANEAVSLSNSLVVNTLASGQGGNINIQTKRLLLTDGAQVSVSNLGEGKVGTLRVNASESVELIGINNTDGLFPYPSSLTAQTKGTGDGGNVEITTPVFRVIDGAEVNINTFGKGKGGSLIVNASELVEVIGTSADGQFRSTLNASTSPFLNPITGVLNPTTGDGGNVQITTPVLMVTDGGLVSVGTFSEGKGGNLIVDARKLVQVMGTSADGQFQSSLDASTLPFLNTTTGVLNPTTGDGGNVEISTPVLMVTDGGVLSAATFSQGNAGNLSVNASEQVQLSGTGGLFVNATTGSTAGDLTVNTNKMSVTDGAQVTVSSPQGQAGNLNITANTLTLNRGTLSAVTGTSSTEGGANINLKGLEFLRMDNESLISASALANANGGNVTIDSTLIVATPPTGSEGSDIIANAEQGNGGRVDVTTEGLFGIQFRPQRTPNNDITVSSTFGISGTYVINTPGIDPSRGLGELPANVVDASQQIDRRCTPQAANQRSSFVVTGRGGIPPNPNDTLQGESVITPNWVTLDSDVETNTPPTPTTPKNSAPKQLVEAQGWSLNQQGQVILTAEAPNVTPHNTWQTPVQCAADTKPVQRR